MANEIDNYLHKVNNYLKPIIKSEREDIILEIKSEIYELGKSGNTNEEIITRLGEPKQLARAYIENGLCNSNNIVHDILSTIAYVLIVGFSGVFVLPFTAISSIVFLVSGIICPVTGIIKFIAYLFGNNIESIGFTLGKYSANPIEFLPISLVIGILLMGLSYLMWKITLDLVKYMARKR